MTSLIFFNLFSSIGTGLPSAFVKERTNGLMEGSFLFGSLKSAKSHSKVQDYFLELALAMTLYEELIHKIETKRAVVGVIGLGYVGLPLILCFAERGFKSIGFDIDAAKMDASGERLENHIHEDED